MYGHWTVYDPNDCTIEDEMQKYRNSGMYWDDPQPAQHCHSFDKRNRNTRSALMRGDILMTNSTGEYEARLQAIPAGYDRNKACNYMPITIHDQVIEKPDLCELRVSKHTSYHLQRIHIVRSIMEYMEIGSLVGNRTVGYTGALSRMS